jgi:hypothetical protein
VRACLALVLVACGASDEPEPPHLLRATELLPRLVENTYGEPVSIEAAPNGEVRATTKCGSFVSELLRQSYPELEDGTLLRELTGMGSADAEHWYDAIAGEAQAGGVRLRRIDAIDELRAGDIVAAKYPSGDATGHVFLYLGPPRVNAYSGGTLVEVLDSTQSPHSADTRGRGGEGIGRGWLRLYPADDGAIAGWRWSLDDTTAFFANGTCAVAACESRPLVVGRLELD